MKHCDKILTMRGKISGSIFYKVYCGSSVLSLCAQPELFFITSITWLSYWLYWLHGLFPCSCNIVVLHRVVTWCYIGRTIIRRRPLKLVGFVTAQTMVSLFYQRLLSGLFLWRPLHIWPNPWNRYICMCLFFYQSNMCNSVCASWFKRDLRLWIIELIYT